MVQIMFCSSIDSDIIITRVKGLHSSRIFRDFRLDWDPTLKDWGIDSTRGQRFFTLYYCSSFSPSSSFPTTASSLIASLPPSLSSSLPHHQSNAMGVEAATETTLSGLLRSHLVHTRGGSVVKWWVLEIHARATSLTSSAGASAQLRFIPMQTAPSAPLTQRSIRHRPIGLHDKPSFLFSITLPYSCHR